MGRKFNLDRNDHASLPSKKVIQVQASTTISTSSTSRRLPLSLTYSKATRINMMYPNTTGMLSEGKTLSKAFSKPEPNTEG